MAKMLLGLAAVIVTTLSAEAQIAAGETAPEKSTRSIAGQVVDADSGPVVNAYVLLFDQSSGIPLMGKTYRPLSDDLLAGGTNFAGVACQRTDQHGRFRFAGVPAGRYRLVAQLWPNAQPRDAISDVMAREVKLCGIANDLTVTDDSAPEVVLRPLGKGALQIDDNLSRDGVLVAFSTAPTRADPESGFVGWGGAFAQHLIGWNRKLDGPMTISGLPEGTIHVALCGFVADDMSGWGAGKVTVKNDRVTKATIPIHSVWAGHHRPPKRLQPLFDEVKSMDRRGFRNMLHANQIELPQVGGMQGIWHRTRYISRHLDRQVTMPSGTKAALVDVMAVAQYLWVERLRERGEQ